MSSHVDLGEGIHSDIFAECEFGTCTGLRR